MPATCRVLQMGLHMSFSIISQFHYRLENPHLIVDWTPANQCLPSSRMTDRSIIQEFPEYGGYGIHGCDGLGRPQWPTLGGMQENTIADLSWCVCIVHTVGYRRGLREMLDQFLHFHWGTVRSEHQQWGPLPGNSTSRGRLRSISSVYQEVRAKTLRKSDRFTFRTSSLIYFGRDR